MRELVDRLLQFVAVNQTRINRALFDPDYVDGSTSQPELRRMGGEFVNQILTATFDKFQSGELETGEAKVYRFSADADPDDFPFADDED